MLVFGCILLAIGLIAYFYEIQVWFDHEEIINREYPYQTMGIILTIAGIFFAGASFLKREQRQKR
jgi:hypothetical protein